MHWTDEQLIASLYGVGPENDHLRHCQKCESRRASLWSNRGALEDTEPNEKELSFEFLAAQRRAVCERLAARPAWPSIPGWRRWAPAAMALLLLGGGAAVYEKHHAGQVAGSQLSDAQLAFEVSRMSQDWQDQPAAPLQGLFE